MPDTSEGLTNLSSDLKAVLEGDALKDACTKYWKGATDRKSMLLCGKSMFFDQPFGTAGLSEKIAKFYSGNFPDQLGYGFSKIGGIEDPRRTDHMPIGLAPTNPSGNVAFTCASCHFAQLPDGRYSVGAPNHNWQYGKEILTIGISAGLALGSSTPADHDPAAVAMIQPVLDKINSDIGVKLALVSTVAGLAGSNAPAISVQNEHYYATWNPGTMDFIIQPLPFDDDVLTISKIIGIWSQPTKDEISATGMESAMLAWTGDASSLTAFVKGFVVIGQGDVAAWPEDKLMPLVEYVYSLRAPSNPNPPDAVQVARGKQLFSDKGCISCHDGPRGSGKRLYSYSEIGTDSQMQYWLDASGDGKACCGFDLAGDVTLNRAIKSPRLAGMWALKRFLHNGSVSSLQELFCVNGPRMPITTPAYGNQGHDYTCNGLSADDKTALIAFLLAH